MDLPILTRSTDVQATLLNFLGQEAIAHAATIFATLAAAFAFTQAVGKKRIATFSVLTLNVLLGIAIYAALRLIYYGKLWGTVLTTSPTSNISLTDYWSQIANVASHSIISSIFGLATTLPSLSLSWAIGFVAAVGVAAYCLDGKQDGWKGTFHRVSLRLKGLFVLAVSAYLVEQTLVQLTVYLFAFIIHMNSVQVSIYHLTPSELIVDFERSFGTVALAMTVLRFRKRLMSTIETLSNRFLRLLQRRIS